MYIYIYMLPFQNKKWRKEAQVTFLNPSPICSSCKRKFVVYPFVDEEINRSYQFANGD